VVQTLTTRAAEFITRCNLSVVTFGDHSITPEVSSLVPQRHSTKSLRLQAWHDKSPIYTTCPPIVTALLQRRMSHIAQRKPVTETMLVFQFSSDSLLTNW